MIFIFKGKEFDLRGYNNIMNFLRSAGDACEDWRKMKCYIGSLNGKASFYTLCQDFICLPSELQVKLKKLQLG